MACTRHAQSKYEAAGESGRGGGAQVAAAKAEYAQRGKDLMQLLTEADAFLTEERRERRKHKRRAPLLLVSAPDLPDTSVCAQSKRNENEGPTGVCMVVSAGWYVGPFALSLVIGTHRSYVIRACMLRVSVACAVVHRRC